MTGFITTIEDECHGFKLATLGERGKYMNYGAHPIEVGGAILEAWQPADDDAKPVMVLRVYKDGVLIREEESPMGHTNLFGVDVEDVASFESMTEGVIQALNLE